MMHLLCTRGIKEKRDDVMENSSVIRRLGKKGRGKGNFNNPCGIAVTENGNAI